jgi:transglutaminase-like putative cysteine protease
VSGYSIAGIPSTRLRDGERTRTLPGAALAAELLAFAALALFASLHWTALVKSPPAGRALLVVLIATAAGAALAGSALLPRAAAWPLRALIALVACGAALVAMGLPARLLEPAHWDELSAGLDRGLVGLQSADYPVGPDSGYWVRLTLLLGAPAVVAVAALVTFWPAGRARPAMRVAGLGLLLVLFGSAVAQQPFGAQLVRGIALLLLIAAWLWAPRLASRDVLGAAAFVVITGLLALPVAAKLDGSSAWIDYKHWRWDAVPTGEVFSWDHVYGPLDWPRKGRTVLYVKSDRPYYWKAEALDGFDGFRWYRSGTNAGTNPGSEIPSDALGADGRARGARPDWYREIQVDVQRLRSPVAIGAGTTFFVRGAGNAAYSSDGTTLLDRPLREGESYRAEVYVPEPNAAQLRDSSAQYEGALLHYTNFQLPRRGEVFNDTTTQRGNRLRPSVSLGLRGTPGSATPNSRRQVLRSPYRRTYLLARRLAARQGTAYGVATSIQSYLKRQYVYNERTPRHNYPLPAFLFQDGYGYCQQFSGAMALMLRMNGIPARVATGFAPGTFDIKAKEWRVRDQDAHSWVEVYFSGIGWVTFDPTPPAAPANRAAGGSAAAGASRVQNAPHGRREGPLGAERATNGLPSSAQSGGKLPWWGVALMVVGVIAAVLLALVWARPVANRRRAHPVDADLRELEHALRRLGYRVEPGTTLAQLERRLERSSGPDAGGYVRHLRELRYSPIPGAGPTRADRRALRRALGRSGGPLQRLRAVLALPPGLGRKPRRA